MADPLVGVTSPNSVRRVVVLPAPLGPRNPTTVPWSTAKLKSSTATTGPKRLVSPWMVMTAMASSSAPAGLLVEADHIKGAEHSSTVRSGAAGVVGPWLTVPCRPPGGHPGPMSTSGGLQDPVEAGSSGEEGSRSQQDPDAGGSQRPDGVPVGRPGPLPGLAEVGLLVLDAVVVVQHARLAGADPAVTSVEPARWMVMVDQHGCSSRSTASLKVSGQWS